MTEVTLRARSFRAEHLGSFLRPDRLMSAVRQAREEVTPPSPDVMHDFLGPKSADEAVHPDIEQYCADLAAICRAGISELAALGCAYLQLDDAALPCNCDLHARAAARAFLIA